ncbi:MAG: hypothetical protein RIR79_20 [Pseudomonadota bacterium]|jgi:hypothetical protein
MSPIENIENIENIANLVYVSSAALPITRDKLLHVLERSRQRNKEHHVTGVLLFDAGNFMQFIEGPAAGLEIIYHHIKHDPLHTGIIELSRETSHERIFDQWAMGFRAFNDVEISDSWLYDELLEAKVTHHIRDTSSAAILLHGFWSRGLRK